MEKELFLASKLAPPRNPARYLERPHLTEQLAQGLNRRLTALVARAGYGKSTTLSHFLQQAGVRHLWLRLDAEDSNPAVFYPYLARGIREILKGGSRLSSALDAGGPPERPLHLVTADLGEVHGPSVLVLDDFHHLDPASPVRELVAGLLQYAPEQVHLYICSRMPLPLPVARLKVLQEAEELGEEDLRFSPADTAAYLADSAGLAPDDAGLSQVYALTEGWPAAMVLLAAHLRRRGTLVDFVRGACPPDLLAYLTEEILGGLPAALRSFAEESAVLEVCDPGMLDGVLDRTDSAGLIEQLIGSDLLLEAVTPGAYRYHHLLRRFLQQRLKQRDGGQTYRELSRRAGELALEGHLPIQATLYYLQGQWHQDAAALMQEHVAFWLHTSQLHRLSAALAELPSEVKSAHPWIALCEARQSFTSSLEERARGLVRMALTGFSAQGDRRGTIHAYLLIAELALGRMQFDAMKRSCDTAEQLLLPEFRNEEAMLRQLQARLIMATNGSREEIESALRKALTLSVELGDQAGEASVSNLLGILRTYEGDYPSAIRLLERSTELYRLLGDPPHEVGASLAWAYLTVGRFQSAERICEPLMAYSTRTNLRAHVGTYLLHCYIRQGEFARAYEMAQISYKLVEEVDSPPLRTHLTILLSSLYRLSGKPHSAIRFANEAMTLVRQSELNNTYDRSTIETALLHLFHTGNASAAARLAQRALAREGPREGYPYDRTLLLLLQALALFRQSRTGARPEAMGMLQEGLAECRRRGFEFFCLQEWPMALAVVVYGLAYGVEKDFCRHLVGYMHERLPEGIIRSGIELMEPEARLVPAAWRALEHEQSRESFSRLLAPADRRRIIGLAVGPAALAIQCLGPLSVTVGAEPVDVKALKRRKAGQLLVLLLSSENPMPREQVIDRLWPNLEQTAADTSLRVALHHLRRLLEPHLDGQSKSRYIQSERGLLWFSRRPEAMVDLDQFRSAIVRADAAVNTGDRAAAALAYEEACRLYQGDLMADDPYSAAVQDLRSFLRARLLRALDWLGAFYEAEAGDLDRALRTYQQRLAHDETYEPAHQALMRLYLARGQSAEVQRQYAACKEALAGLSALPSAVTESLLRQGSALESSGTAVSLRPARKSAQR